MKKLNLSAFALAITLVVPTAASAEGPPEQMREAARFSTACLKQAQVWTPDHNKKPGCYSAMIGGEPQISCQWRQRIKPEFKAAMRAAMDECKAKTQAHLKARYGQSVAEAPPRFDDREEANGESLVEDRDERTNGRPARRR